MTLRLEDLTHSSDTSNFVDRELQATEADSPQMTEFPDIIRKLPPADTRLKGVTLWLLQGPTASATFFQAQADSEVPEHTHAAQWGIVVDGEMRLTTGGRTRICRRGDEYFVPAGVPHSASFKAGFRVVDFFDDPNRYRPRK